MAINSTLIFLSVKLSKIKWLKFILVKPWRKYKAYCALKQVRQFHKYGLETLEVFNKCMVDNGYKYSLAFGTLLGAVREHDFIPHDNDIDLAMWINDYTPKLIDDLKKYGIKHKYAYTIEDGKIGKEDTFEYKGVQLDIFYFYKDDQGQVYCNDFITHPDSTCRKDAIRKHGGLLPRKLYLPLDEKLETIDFKGLKLSIPSNYHELLSFRYGENYMTPLPGWRPQTKYIIEMNEYVGKIEEK